MKLKLEFKGRKDPFEGDCTLHLKTIPDGVQINDARVIATPQQCLETITFRNGVGDWGATKDSGTNPNWEAVDLHTRRKVTQMRARAGSDDVAATLQVDIGGLWVRLAENGTILTDGDTELTVPLSSAFDTVDILPLIVQRLKLQDDSDTVEISQLTVLSYPSNLSLRLGEMPPFWAKPGELVEEETSPEFSEVLQAFLAEAEVVNGFYDVPLVVHSDSIACLDLTMEIDYVQEQSVLPAGVTETKLLFKHNGLAETEANLLQIEVPLGSRVAPGKTNGRVEGAFEPSRVVYGPLGEVTPVADVSILTNQSQAQPILLEEDMPATAIDLLLSAVTRTAELDVLLLEDTDGKPGSTSKFSPPATISLDRDVAGTPTWISTSLPLEVQFEPGKRLWLVLHARNGEVRWHVNTDAESVGLHFTDNGGLSWRQTTVPNVADPLAGLFRLRHTPPRFQMPIELQVGTGDAAQRVSLERLAPMGRVDFSLDFDEVAQAINKYTESSGAVPCPEGEHLVNGDFSEWTAVGDTIGNLQTLQLPPATVPSALAIVPDGQQMLIGATNGQLLFMDLPCHTIESDTVIDFGNRPIHIIVNQQSNRAYIITATSGAAVTTRSSLHVINIEARQSIESFVNLNSLPLGLALTPDGSRLYLTEFDAYSVGRVRAIDTALLEQSLLSTAETINVSDVEINDDLPDITFGDDLQPTGLAISPDGRHLYVSVNDETGEPGPGFLHVFDIGSHQEITPAIEIGSRPSGMAITPDGNTAVVACVGDNTIWLIDTTTHAVIANPLTLPGSVILFPISPSTIIITPGGRRAFVANTGNQTISIVDLPRRTIVDSIPLDEPAFSLRADITPDGLRLYLIHEQYHAPDSLAYIPIGMSFPAEWTITAGTVLPFCYDDPFHQLAILGARSLPADFLDAPSAISQVVPVMANCPYEFSFWGRTVLAEATAEVIWLGDICGEVSSERFPIELMETEQEMPPEIFLHRSRLTAPEGAKQAEIRFTSAGGGPTIIDNVSFEATQEAIINNDLRITQGPSQGWNILPSHAPGLSLSVHGDEFHVQNNGVNQITFSQTIPVTADRPFTLSFQGRPVNATSTQPSPHLELQWINSEGVLQEDVISLEIVASNGDHRIISDQVPSEVVEAELRLVIPGRTTLAVSRISFKPIETVTVPIHFIAHAPGEMTITDFRVAFDTAVAPKPPIPESGLCTPTPPGREPGSQPGDYCFCPCCGGEGHLNNPQPTRTPADRPAVRGTCLNCGTELVQPGGAIAAARIETQPATMSTSVLRTSGVNLRRPAISAIMNREPTPQASPPIRPIEEDIAAILPMTPAEWAALAGTSLEMGIPPLTDIKGIGQTRAEQLNQLGLGSIATLAEADPERVAADMKGMSVEQAHDLIAEAKAQMLLAEATQAPLVSCVMPTYNRPLFVPKAVEYFLRQDYPHRELIIVDDGTDSIGHLVTDDERIHYIHLEDKLTIGAKMNVGCEVASGAIIARWEDDVWMDYWRLSYQVAALLKHQADICGVDNFLHYDVINQSAWHSTRPPGTRPWMLGSTLCFTQAYWARNPFLDVNLGDEIHFIRSERTAKIFNLQAVTFLVDIIHGGNTAPKDTSSDRWHAYPVEEIQGLMGSDWSFYLELSQLISL
jgi:DNA-binding beta-propeller fold protein YncE/predicted flap endonuclease-1-like 5' DNA nuclease